MKSIVFLVLGLMSFGWISPSFNTQNQEWIVSSSSIKFKIKNAGFNVEGTFSGLTANIVFDASKGYGNFIEASLPSNSINTGNSIRDGHLRKKEYFDVLQFPDITMKASLFGKESTSSFRGYFKLTIKGKTRDVLVPFTFTENDGKALFKGAFTINRLDFGVGESSMILSDKVTISLEVSVRKNSR